jgi:threonine/homoserine/homoserine lactone efflux protein
METVLVFLVVSAISFAGSLQLGVVNVMVIKTAIQRNLTAALWVASGGCLPEMGYAGLAIFASSLIQTSFFFYLEIAVIPIFALIGVLYWRTPPRNQPLTPDSPMPLSPLGGLSFFWLGFGLACLNPQLLIFWFSVAVFLNSFDVSRLNDLGKEIAFVLGTSFGAWLLLSGLAWLIHKNKSWADYLQRRNMNQLVGGIFMGLSVIQLIQISGR